MTFGKWLEVDAETMLDSVSGISRQTERRRRPVLLYAVWIGVSLAVLSLILAIGAGFGTRFGWWHFRVGFSILWWGALGGATGAVISLIGLIAAKRGDSNGPEEKTATRQEIFPAAIGLVVGLFVFAVPLQWMATARRVPPIHDITTDLENPPPFVAILKLRESASNPVEYGGPEVAAQQRAGYPKLGPAFLSLPPDQAFVRALVVARSMEWKIIDANKEEGRIEATDTTFWFGFRDDIVIRITPVEQGSRIDVRSVSRVGKSDVGANARRIEKYLKKLTRS